MNKNPLILRVLVVEDEALLRWSITETLTHAGHAVIEAKDGAAAVRALTETADAVDAVVFDYQLPDANDLALLARLRRLSPNSAVIVLTAYRAPEVTRAAIDLGVDRVMQKPFDMDDLEPVLLTACGRSGRAPSRADADRQTPR